MTTDYRGATDDIFGLITKTTLQQSMAMIGYEPELRFQGVPESTMPGTDKVWMRASLQTVDESQKTFSTCEGSPGKKLYTSYGLVFVQIFIPKNINGMWIKGTTFAAVLRNAFRGSKSGEGVWFRNSRIEELAPEADFFRINVVSEFEYSEIY